MASTKRGQEERRSTERVTLRCTLYVFVDGAPGIIQAISTNVSSRGLYCNSEIPIPVGKRLRCLIELTPEGFRSTAGSLCLECFLEVVRSERRGSGFGLGCRIHKYQLMRPDRPEMPERVYAGDDLGEHRC